MSFLEIENPLLSRICDKLGISKNNVLRSLIAFFECFANRVSNHHVFLVAAGIAFNILIYIIPLLLVIVFAINFFFSVEQITMFLSHFLNEILPPGEQTEKILSTVITEITSIFNESKIAGIIGICTLAWISSLLLGAVRSGLNMVYEQEDKKVFILYKLKDICFTFILAVMVLLTIYILPIIGLVQSMLNQIIPDFIERYLNGATFYAITLAMTFLLFFFIYQFVPNERIAKRNSLISALICVILVEISRRIFAFYIAGFASYGKFYGTYAIIVSMCVWLYYLTLILLFCAELSRLICELLDYRSAKKTAVAEKLKP